MKYTIVIGIIILLAAAYIFSALPALNTIERPQKENRERIPPVIHWHPHLAIIINSNETAVPVVGIYEDSEALIHTHDTSGILHMEQTFPSNETLAIGYFFHEVWNKTLNASCIFEYCANATHEVKMWVNGKRNFEFENFSMRDRDIIVINYGVRDEVIRQF